MAKTNTREILLNKTIQYCLQCLIQTKNYAIVDVLGTIWEKRPKIYVVPNWPQKLYIQKTNGTNVEIMEIINSLIKAMNCQLVIE